MKIKEKFRSVSLFLLGGLFFVSTTLVSCGDGKKEASSDEQSTEEVMDEEMMEEDHMEENDGMMMEDSATHEMEEHSEEHPSGGGEHPSN